MATRRRAHYQANIEAERAAANARAKARRDRKRVVYQRTCEPCGTPFTATHPGKRYCSSSCRERQKQRARPIPELTRTEKVAIFERDGWRCYLCGHDIDPTLRWPSGHSATVDHVKPVSAGGTNDPDNLRATHWNCNEAKGSGLIAA